MEQRRIVIGVGGGIAAYKVCEVVSALAKRGVAVRVILTETAQQFVTPLTFATLARHPAYGDRDFWQPTHGRPLHIELGEWAELMLIAPLTANTLAKLAYGLADNLLTNTVLASTCPIVLAPAMNTEMWEQATVQRNWQLVQALPRFHGVGPGAGILACDRVGAGRMAEPEALIACLESLLVTQGKRDLAGKRVLISAGGSEKFSTRCGLFGIHRRAKWDWPWRRLPAIAEPPSPWFTARWNRPSWQPSTEYRRFPLSRLTQWSKPYCSIFLRPIGQSWPLPLPM